jgi:hypothetical protein
MMVSIEFFYRQHTTRCNWETFKDREEFLDQVQRKGDKLDKRMMYERKQQMHEKHLKVPSDWILRTIKRELNLFKHDEILDDLHDEHDKTLAYWRQNRQQYPPDQVWDKYYYDLLFKSFESRHEFRTWCAAREKQLKDPVYHEEQHQQQKNAEEEKSLAQEAEQQRRRETPETWEHYKTKQEEASRHAREADLGGTTSET